MFGLFKKKSPVEKLEIKYQELLKEARRNLLREKRKAKRKWQFEFAQRCQSIDFQTNPKEAWQMITHLTDGFQKHHKNLAQKLFKNRDGIVATNEK